MPSVKVSNLGTFNRIFPSNYNHKPELSQLIYTLQIRTQVYIEGIWSVYGPVHTSEVYTTGLCSVQVSVHTTIEYIAWVWSVYESIHTTQVYTTGIWSVYGPTHTTQVNTAIIWSVYTCKYIPLRHTYSNMKCTHIPYGYTYHSDMFRITYLVNWDYRRKCLKYFLLY